MPTISATTGNAYHVGASPFAKVPYLMEVEIDAVDLIASKGSALAQGDVIEALDIPKNTILLAAGMIAVTEHTGTSTDLTLDLGVTGGDVDNFVDGWDYDAAAVDANAAQVAYGTGTKPLLFTADDTLDILITTMTGTWLTGKIRVWALAVDVSGRDAPGVAAAGS